MSNQFLDAACAFFADFSTNATPARMLAYFSAAHPFFIQHSPAFCLCSSISRLSGSNGIRSYFDTLSAHFTHSPLVINTMEADPEKRTVVADASITWTWRRSHRRWCEDFICTIRYDEALKITSVMIETVSEPETCVVRAVDPSALDIDD